jgi:hypothetical protein
MPPNWDTRCMTSVNEIRRGLIDVVGPVAAARHLSYGLAHQLASASSFNLAVSLGTKLDGST